MFPAHNTKLHRNPCIFVYFFKHQTHFSLSEAFDRRSRKKCKSEHLFCLEWSVRCIQTHALLQKCSILNAPCNAILPEQCTVTEKRSRYPQHILTGGATPATETKREQHGFGCSTSTSLLAASVMLHWKQKRGQKFSLKFPTPLYLEVWNSWCPFSSSVHYFPFEFNQEVAETSQLKVSEWQA